jgi:hypothetical protein
MGLFFGKARNIFTTFPNDKAVFYLLYLRQVFYMPTSGELKYGYSKYSNSFMGHIRNVTIFDLGNF